MAEFVPRTQSDITNALLAYRTSDPEVSTELLPTDLSIGSLERAHVETVALAMEESDQRFALGALDAIPESCYRCFGFGLLPPQAALGSVIFSTFAPVVDTVTIPSGTQLLASSGALFNTTAEGTIDAGQTSSAPVPVRAAVAGTVGNVPANSINLVVTPIAGVDLVINANAAAGGSDTETDDARATRFAAYIQTIIRGTKEAIEFAALSATPAIFDARAIEPFLLSPVPAGVPDAGLVWLFADDGTDNVALDPGVQNAISQWVEGFVDGTGRVVPGYKAAGTVVQIVKVPRVAVYLRGSITLLPEGVSRWSDVQANLMIAATNYFSSLRIGQQVSYGNLITALTQADPDISEVQLWFWLGQNAAIGLPGTPQPGYASAISGNDLSPLTPSPTSSGARTELYSGTTSSTGGTDLGPDGVTPVTYPEWILA
jgi:hypothetical protein